MSEKIFGCVALPFLRKRVKPLVFCLLLALSKGAFGTTYCVSSTGADTNPGTATGPNCTGIVSAWRSLEQVSKESLKPGDEVLFQAGGLWRATLTPPTSGSSSSPILYGAYGSGAKPILDGSNLVTSWSKSSAAGGAVYAAPVQTEPAAVWFAEVLGSRKGNLAALQNDRDWYWHDGVLSVFSAVNPVIRTVEAAARNNVVLLNEVSYVTLSGLDLRHANGAAVYVRSSCYTVLDHLAIHDTVSHGVYMGLGGGSHTVRDSEIFNVGVSSKFGGGNGIQTDDSLTMASSFQGNSIHDVGNVNGGDHAIYDQSPGDVSSNNTIYNIPWRSSSGMKIDGDHARVYGNYFYNIPSGGIWIDPYSDVQVTNNVFYNVGTSSPFAAVSFTGNGAQSDVRVENNIFYVPGRAYSTAIAVNGSGTGFYSNYNDVYGQQMWYGQWANGHAYSSRQNWTSATGLDSSSITTDPLFVNAATGNFSLQSGSPALSLGTVIATPQIAVSALAQGGSNACSSQ